MSEQNTIQRSALALVLILAAMSALIVLPACTSSGTDYQRLSSELANHAPSAYVSATLKQAVQAKSGPITKADQSNQADNTHTDFAKLASRKKSASNFERAVQQNGLYQPGPGFARLRQRINSAPNQQAKEQYMTDFLGRRTDLNKVLDGVLVTNPDIRAALASARASLNQYDQVAYLDDMLAQYAAYTRDTRLPGSLGKAVKPVQGAFPFPGLQSLKAAIIDQVIESERLKLRQTTQDAITRTRVAYAELQYLNREIVLVGETIELLKLLKKDLQDSYSSSTSAESSRETTGLSELLSIDIELDKKRNQRVIAQNRRDAARSTLGALLNRSFSSGSSTIDINNRLPLPRKLATTSILNQRALNHRVEIALLEADREKIDRMIRLLEKRFYPDFSAGYSLKSNPTDAAQTEGSPRPLIRKDDFFARNDAYLTEVRARRDALSTRIKALKQRTSSELHQAIENYRNFSRTRSMYESSVLPKAQTTLEVAESLLETGKAANLQVIRANLAILDYRLLGLQARRDAAIARARLERLVGQTL